MYARIYRVYPCNVTHVVYVRACIMDKYVENNNEMLLILLLHVGGYYIYDIYIFIHSQIMSNCTINKVACARDSEDNSVGKDILHQGFQGMLPKL